MKKQAIFILLFLIATSTSAEEIKIDSRDITVTTEVRAWSGLKSARVTAVIEQVSPTTSEAYSSLAQKEAKIASALSKIIPSALLQTREEKISSLADSQQRILPNTQVKITRHIGVEVNDILKLGQVIDAFNSSGAQFVSDIEYFAPKNTDSELVSISTAGERAKQKAEAVAKSLGVKIGKILSVSLNDEPAGSQLQQQIVRGGNAIEFVDSTQNIYVNVSFEILGGETQKNLDERLNRLLEDKK